MKESEWNSCTDPDTMLSLLRSSGQATERKLRLLLVATCRLLRHRIMDQRSREALLVAEEYADGLTSPERLGEASQRAHHVLMENTLRKSPSTTLQAIWLSCAAAGNAENLMTTRVPLDGRLRVALIREIFGRGPFQPTLMNSGAFGETVVNLARAAYEDRDLHTGLLDAGRLAVLADALEEDGCTDASVLGHLRGPGPHVRGCFALDAILNRA